jgi:dihydrofolate reductase
MGSISGHVFIATSLDGFIAKEDGDIEWLLSRDDPSEDHGYNAFIADIDVIVMGRGTYEKALSFKAWPYTKAVLVLSKQLAAAKVPPELEGKLRFSDLSPEAAMQMLVREGSRRAYIDGGKLIQSFLRAGLIADMVVTQVPVLLGQGLPLFGALAGEISLKLLSSKSFPSGLVQSHYQVHSSKH